MGYERIFHLLHEVTLVQGIQGEVWWVKILPWVFLV